jgi:hypothetical protein
MLHLAIERAHALDIVRRQAVPALVAVDRRARMLAHALQHGTSVLGERRIPIGVRDRCVGS